MSDTATITRSGPFWEFLAGRQPAPPAAVTLGWELSWVAPERGEIEVFFDARADFANPIGNVQGGFLAAMLDDTLGPALAATLGDGEFAPTLELKVSFLRPPLPAGSPARAAWSIAADRSHSWPENCMNDRTLGS